MATAIAVSGLALSACGEDSSSPAARAAATAPTPTPSSTPSPTGGTWQMVWSDEFEGSELDTANWTALNDCWGGGNEERQCYTPRPENVSVGNGRLVITARSEQWTGPAWPVSFGPGGTDPNEQRTKPYTSGRITTQGNFSRTYGRFEMRARIPEGQGVWAAFWMMPEESAYGTWAASGEIDILEVINPGVACDDCETGGENSIYGALHYGGQWPDNDALVQNRSFPGLLDGEFHTYGVIWEEGRISWTVDGETYATAQASDWYSSGNSGVNAPFDQDFHLILNLAIGGRWPEGDGARGVSDAGFPKRMEVDWVRVWECDANPETGQGCAGG